MPGAVRIVFQLFLTCSQSNAGDSIRAEGNSHAGVLLVPFLRPPHYVLIGLDAEMTSAARPPDSETEKYAVEQKEDIEHGRSSRHSSTKHGDRALAIIGDGRVLLTDEDVCLAALVDLIGGDEIHPQLTAMEAYLS